MQSTRLTGALMAMMGLAMLTGHPDVSAPAPAVRSAVKVVALTTDNKTNPLGINAPHPRLSWKLEANGRGVVQSAYQIRVARNERHSRSGSRLVWISQAWPRTSHLRPYEGPAPRVRPEVRLAGPHRGRFRSDVGLERSCVVGDGPAAACRLACEMD